MTTSIMININNIINADEPNCTCGMTLDEEQLFEIIKWWSEGVIQMIINTLGILGNFFSLLVLLSKDQKNLFNMSLTMLIFFDTIFNITDILESIRRIHYNSSWCIERSWFQIIHLYLWPQFLYPLRDISIASSMYMTITLATERYLAVSKPITSYIEKDKRTWKNMIWYTAVMVTAIIACMSPLFFEFQVETLYLECARNGDAVRKINKTIYLEDVTDGNTSNGCELYPQKTAITLINSTEFRVDRNYITTYKTIFQTMFTGVVPLMLLIIINSLTLKHIRNRYYQWRNSGKCFCAYHKSVLIKCYCKDILDV